MNRDSLRKILFVASGNSKTGINPVVKLQGQSLETFGLYIDYFPIKGKGLIGYLKNIPKFRKLLKNTKYDIIHAHYFDSSIVPSLSFINLPIVVSLMGSDVYIGKFNRIIIRIFKFIFWNKIIVKSESLKEKINIRNSIIIPNGVDIERFKLIDSLECKKKLYFNFKKKQILFLSDPNREEKNYLLSKQAIDLIGDPDIDFKVVYNIDNEIVPIYLNATDILVFSSKWEGSPNLIKEAMACNCPIVSTDVGDVKLLFGEIEGHYLSSFDIMDFADNIRQAIKFSNEKGRTKGRDRIIELGLDSQNIAKKMKSVYEQVILESN